jgi:predicted nucleic acid-binding protein
MAVIIDTNCIASVFSKKSTNHMEFSPILDWILNGKGLMVIGGSKYKKELKKTPKYLPIIRLLKEVGKLHNGEDDEIDKYQLKVEELRDNLDFDDPHLPAIVVNTKCRIICSSDTRSVPYVTDNKYYPKGITKPVYYTSSKNKNILTDKYIDRSLKPLCKIKKSQAKKIAGIIK